MKIITTIATLLLLPFILSCNAYSPLASTSSDADRLEEATKCLQDGDFSCAITQYSALSDATKKSEKLCMVYLAKGGITLSALINTINQSSATMLGGLSNRLVPWTQTKSDDLDLAKTQCATFAAVSTSGDQGVLLKSISLLAHCAIRMTKTDLFVATSDADTTCTTAGNANGVIVAGDIGPATTATTSSLSTTSPGMCVTDVTTCVTDISGISASSLVSSGLTDLNTALGRIPANLKDTAAASTAIRFAVRSTI